MRHTFGKSRLSIVPLKVHEKGFPNFANLGVDRSTLFNDVRKCFSMLDAVFRSI